jgi:hypothetical protein
VIQDNPVERKTTIKIEKSMIQCLMLKDEIKKKSKATWVN